MAPLKRCPNTKLEVYSSPSGCRVRRGKPVSTGWLRGGVLRDTLIDQVLLRIRRRSVYATENEHANREWGDAGGLQRSSCVRRRISNSARHGEETAGSKPEHRAEFKGSKFHR